MYCGEIYVEGAKKMKLKRTDRVWAISLFVAGIATMILVGSNLAGVRLPDMVVRIIGVLDLTALFTLAFLTAILQTARIYSKAIGKSTLLAVCSRDSLQVLSVCSIKN